MRSSIIWTRSRRPRITVKAGQLGVGKGGVSSRAISVAEEHIDYASRPIPGSAFISAE